MGPRVNWRYGGIVSGIRSIYLCIELVAENEEDGGLCEVATLCPDLLKRQDRDFVAMLDNEDRGFVVQDSEQRVLFKYRPNEQE